MSSPIARRRKGAYLAPIVLAIAAGVAGCDPKPRDPPRPSDPERNLPRPITAPINAPDPASAPSR